tara:strand:+ start:14181 stop:14408 length:228 start_codon:yes stop_codon:yes gene_type:complete
MQGFSFSQTHLKTTAFGISLASEEDISIPKCDNGIFIAILFCPPHLKSIPKCLNSDTVYILFHTLIKKIRYLYIV